MTDQTTKATRSIEIEREIPLPPDAVFETLTDPAELSNWFPLDAEVDPRVGGRVWLSWGPGCEGEAPIHVYEPPNRVGWTENYGNDADGRPVEVAVDFYVEGKAGGSVVRLVQSGLSADSDWDGMYDALKDGWTYFMFNLVHYLVRHRGKRRGMAWKRVATDLSREAVWERLMGGGLVSVASDAGGDDAFELRLADTHAGEVVSTRRHHHFAGTLPGLDDSVLFVELEGKHVGLWLSTYGRPEAEVAKLQAELEARATEALAES